MLQKQKRFYSAFTTEAHEEADGKKDAPGNRGRAPARVQRGEEEAGR